MKLLLPIQPWKLPSPYFIEDEKGDQVLRIEGNFFSRRQRMTISDEFGIPVGRVERKFLSIQPQYNIYKGKKKIAAVKRQWKLLQKKIVIITSEGDFLLVKGNTEEYEYAVWQGKKRIAMVSKKIFKWEHSYGLLVPDTNQPLLFVSVAVALELLQSLKIRM